MQPLLFLSTTVLHSLTFTKFPDALYVRNVYASLNVREKHTGK